MTAAVALLSFAGLGGIVAADASPASESGPSVETTLDLGTGALPLLYQEGDHVVFGASADAKAGTPSAGMRRHDGFSTYGDATLIDHYDVRLVESRGIEQLRPFVAEAVAEASAAGGQSLTLLAGTYAPTGANRGQIDIVVSGSSPCGGMWLGCGGPNVDDGKVQSGQVWISPRLFDKPPSQIANTIRHELGHTLGLAHYEYLHEERVQTMHPSRYDATTYESGDTAGLRFTAGNPPVAPANTEDVEPVDPIGFVESASAGPFGVVVRGWAFDPETNLPITVTVLVDGTPTDVVASKDRGAVDGDRRGHAFELVRVVPPGPHEICAIARNVGRGADASLGCRTVVVSSSSVGLVGLQTF